MRHKKKTIHFGRDVDHRKALFKNLVTELVRHGQIETTEAKAKALRPRAERLVTIAKRGRSGKITELVNVVYDELAPRYVERNGGYIRILKTGVRQGDAARLAIIEFVE